MNKFPLAIIIRTLLFIAIGFHVLHAFKVAEFESLLEQRIISFERYIELRDGIRYYLLFFPLCLLINVLYSWRKSKRRRSDGRIDLREFLLPEFNYDDERETEITGKAAKASLAVILIYTAFVSLSYVLLIYSNFPSATYMIFATLSIPVVGLITYYSSYRYYYAK